MLGFHVIHNVQVAHFITRCAADVGGFGPPLTSEHTSGCQYITKSNIYWVFHWVKSLWQLGALASNQRPLSVSYSVSTHYLT